MSNYNYVNRVLIGDGANSGVIAALPTIQKGDLVVLSSAGTPITTNTAANALSAGDSITIASGIGPGQALLSSPIQGKSVSKYEGKPFVAPQEQISFIGYNGIVGTGLDISASNEYRLRISIQEDQPVVGQRQTLQDYNYDGGSTATAEGAIDTILCYFIQKDYGHNELSDKILLERVSDGTFTALAADATVIKGSDTVVSAGHGVTVGSYVRIGGATDEFAIYKVKSVVDVNTFTLDIPYQDTTATVLAANVGIMSVQTEFGFKLTGLPQDPMLSRSANEPYDQYEWILFEAYFSEADGRSYDSAATYKTVQSVNPGNGFWRQVAQREEDAKGYLGDTSKRRFDDTRIDSVVDPTVGYDTIVITHSETSRGDFQGLYNAPLATEIYIPNGGDQGLNSGDEFLHILNGFMVKIGQTAIVL
jgi:hypothetical protein